MQVSSKSFNSNEEMATRFGADGGNISPAISWSTPPLGTKSMALVLDDPDAPRQSSFIHWVLFNVDPASSIVEGQVPPGAVQGKNDAGHDGYHGPRPPSGTHHYHFHLYALDTQLSLSPGSSRDQLVAAMYGHVLANGELVGLFTHH